MEVKFNDVKYDNENFNLKFDNDGITALISSHQSLIECVYDLIYAIKIPTSGKIKVNRQNITNEIEKKTIEGLRNSVSYLNLEYEKYLFNLNVLEDIKYISGNNNLDDLEELLKSFSLDNDILKKSYLNLSKSEKKKIVLISLLLKKSKILLLFNPDIYLDNKSVQNLIKILRRKRKQNFLIIVSSNDSNFLLQVADKVMLINRDTIFDGKKFEVLSDNELMNKNEIQIPNIMAFTNRVLELKNKKIGYRDNINDLIKDIYRNVR